VIILFFFLFFSSSSVRACVHFTRETNHVAASVPVWLARFQHLIFTRRVTTEETSFLSARISLRKADKR